MLKKSEPRVRRRRLGAVAVCVLVSATSYGAWAFRPADFANGSTVTQPPTDAPLVRAGDGQGISGVLNQILREQAGQDADILDGTWLIIYGAEQIPPAAVSAIDPAKIQSIDVLTRPNGSFKGTVVISKKGG